MTTVTWQLESTTGRLVGFKAVGHAGDAPAGENLVCAAVSAVLQTTVLGLREVLGIPVNYRASETDADMSCAVPKVSDELLDRADIILQTAAAGLDSIAKAYPQTLRITRE